MTKEKISLELLLVIVGLLCFLVVFAAVNFQNLREYNNLVNEYNELKESCIIIENERMPYNETRNNTKRVGVYRKPEYYCVWVEGRTPEQIKNTEAHELCHHFIAMEYKHFCAGKENYTYIK